MPKRQPFDNAHARASVKEHLVISDGSMPQGSDRSRLSGWRLVGTLSFVPAS